MTKAERLAAVFAIAFAIIYAPTMDFNWTAATYHPIQGVWDLGTAKEVRRFETGQSLDQLLLAPDGKILVVTYQISGKVGAVLLMYAL